MEVGNSVEKFEYVVDISKSSVNDELYIYGVASTESEDRDGETVDMRSLEKAFGKFMRRSPVLMYYHNGRSDAVGKVVPEFVGEDGTIYKSGVINNELRIVGLISQAGWAADVRTQINEGILQSLSIGGSARKIQKGSKRYLFMSDLHEISIVPIPANEDTLFAVVKAACVGSNCPVDKSQIMEVNTMEKEEIITLIKGVLDESRTESEMAGLRQQVRDMTAADEVAKAAHVDLQKKYDALVKGEEGNEGEAGDIMKSVTDKLDALKIEVEGMKITPIQKGHTDEAPPATKVLGTDIASVIMRTHYGRE